MYTNRQKMNKSVRNPTASTSLSPVEGCLKRSEVSPPPPPTGRDECDFLVPGKWRRDTPSPAQGDDFRWEGRLRAHAAGTSAGVTSCLEWE